MKSIVLPIEDSIINDLKVGDNLLINGKIYTGRDAVLPKICEQINDKSIIEYDFDIKGSAIFHTAVSPAGIGPTSSNKVEIEESIPVLSEYGVKFHLGKGKISQFSIDKLDQFNSVYAVVAPVSAYLKSRVKSRRLVAFKDLGMEAMYELVVEDFPAVVAAIHGKSVYDK